MLSPTRATLSPALNIGISDCARVAEKDTERISKVNKSFLIVYVFDKTT